MVARERRGGGFRSSRAQAPAAENGHPSGSASPTLEVPEPPPSAEAPEPALGDEGASPEQQLERQRRRRSLAWTLGLGALFFVVTLVMVFPSVTQWRTATPGDYGDAFFSQWLLRWDVHGLLSPSRSVFHPNIFWPAQDTLIYSDTGLGVAPVAAVAGYLLGWPLAYNAMYVLGWMASVASAHALARWIGASRAGSVLAGFVFSFAAVRMSHFGHFQMVSAFLAPLSLLVLLRFLHERRWWQPVALGVAAAALFLNVGYVAVAVFPALLVVAAGWMVANRFRPGPRLVPGLLISAGLSLALTWPALTRYSTHSQQLRRNYLPKIAIVPRNFLAPAQGSLLYGGLERWSHSPFENWLFPGFLAVALAVVGAVAVWSGRRRAADPADGTDHASPTDPAEQSPHESTAPSEAPEGELRRRDLLLLLVSTLPALVLAFGKYQVIAGRRITLPYSWVSGVAGYQSIRAFGRFTVVPLIGLAVLAALGYDRLVRGRSHAARVATAVVLGAVMLAEYKSRIVMSPRVDTPQYASVNRALARLPDGPVLELPMGDSRRPVWAFVEAPRMVLSTIDWKPRVNGYSGYIGPDYEKTIDLFNSLDDGGPAKPETLALLDRLGVRYIVIRLVPLDRDNSARGLSSLDEAGADRVRSAIPPERIEGVSPEGGALLIRLRPPPGPSTP